MPEVIDAPPKVVDDKLTDKLKKLNFEPMWQVVLYNDDHHEITEVLNDLMKIFNHSEVIATKIIQEIEINSKGIADVLDKERAQQCVELLKSARYTAVAEPIC